MRGLISEKDARGAHEKEETFERGRMGGEFIGRGRLSRGEEWGEEGRKWD